MRIVFTLLAFAINLIVFGQHDLGLKLNFGLSYLTTKTTSSPPQQYTEKFYPMPSGQAGLFYNYTFKCKLLIGTEILFSQIEGKEYLKFPFIDMNGNLTGDYSEDKIYRHISYLGLPIYIGYSFKKLNINLGFQTHFTLMGRGSEKGKTIYYGQTITWEYKAKTLNITKYDYGARLGLIYKMSNKFSFETNYYFGLTNLISDPQLFKYWTWKVQQWTVGLRFTLFANRSQKTETGKK